MSTEPESPDPGEAAVAALADWGQRNATIDGELVTLAAAAWNSGALGRNITKYAEAAKVDRRRIYAALTAAGIDYKNKGADPRLSRLLAALSALSQALVPEQALAPNLHWKTPANLGPVIAKALAAVGGGGGMELISAVYEVLTVVRHADEADRAILQPFADELDEALSAYQRPPGAPPALLGRRRTGQVEEH
jgi:hypothetical protein